MHTVLVVDDEPASLRAVRRTLAFDHRVLSASDGRQALELMASESVAVLVADQRMPGMSGTELLAHCAGRHPDALRILLTGYTDLDTLQAAINAGHVFAYVSKPWEPRDLRQAVTHAIERYDLEADRRRLIAALQDSCDQLQRESETKARLLTLAAHELGTPLHLLSSSFGLLRESFEADDAGAEGGPAGAADAAHLFEVGARALQWMARVLGDLERFGRLEHGIGLRREPVCLAELIERLVAEHRLLASGRTLQLVATVDPALPRVALDPTWMRCALACLLSNAIRFTPDGGRIAIAAVAEAGGVVVSVCDDGIGIAPEHQGRLFEPFGAAGGDLDAHGSGAFSFGARGLGLGLATVQRIVRLHRGELAIDSRPGGGTRVVVRIPSGDGAPTP